MAGIAPASSEPISFAEYLSIIDKMRSTTELHAKLVWYVGFEPTTP